MSEKRRRSVFGSEPQPSRDLGDLPEKPLPEAAPQIAPMPRSVVDQLTFAQTRKASSSPRPPRPGQVSYRGFPGELKEAIHAAAKELQVNIDEVVRATLEYALGMYWSGKLELDPMPARIKMTLYPSNAKTIVQSKPRKGQKRKKANKPRWTTVVTFRGIPDNLQEAVRQIAEDRDIPVGEVAAYLIESGIRAFRSGELVLLPVPKPGANTLFGE
jgi:hypothetical protein